MVNTYSVYLLNGKSVSAYLWTKELNECIATVQSKTHDRSTKKAIRTAIVADLNSGRTSVVNGREFERLVKVVI